MQVPTALLTLAYLNSVANKLSNSLNCDCLISSFDQRTSHIVLKTSWYFYLFLAIGYNGDSTVPNLPDS